MLVPITVINDTINNTGDSCIIFNKTVNRDFLCNKGAVSNLGMSINSKANGDFYAINQLSDTILFHSHDTIGSSWVCYKNQKQNLLIKTSISLIKDTIIFGEIDTCITYTFYPFDTNNVLLTQSSLYLAQSQFALNNGFTSTPDFRWFPFVAKKYFVKPYIKLYGRMKNDYTEKVGTAGIWKYQLGDMNIGDEVQEKYTNYCPLGPTSSFPIKTQDAKIYTFKSVLNRVEDSSQILLTMRRQKWNYGSIYWVNQNSHSAPISQWDSLKTDTLVVRITKDYNIKNHLPTILNELDDGVLYDATRGCYTGHQSDAYTYYPFKINDSCWRYPMDEDPVQYEDYFFLSGIDSGFYYGGRSCEYFEPTYFKNMNNIWGTPYPFALGIQPTEITKKVFCIYPNPAISDFRILLAGLPDELSVNIKITNATGTYVSAFTQRLSDLTNISNLQNGIYFIEVTVDHNKYYCKLIKE